MRSKIEHYAKVLGLLAASLNKYIDNCSCLERNIPVVVMHGMGDAAENTGMVHFQQVHLITAYFC